MMSGQLAGSFHTTRPVNLDAVSARETLWHAFFPLQAAINKGIFSIAGNAEVPKPDQKFPIFRNACVNPIEKSIGAWWLWDGLTQWRVDSLTEDQKHLSFEQIINDTLLIERLEKDWRPGEHPWD